MPAPGCRRSSWCGSGGEANQSGHPHIIGVVVFYVPLPRSVNDRRFELLGEVYQLFMRSGAAATAHQGDVALNSAAAGQLFQLFFRRRHVRQRRVVPVAAGAFRAAFSATSPGSTTTETPRLITALRMAMASTCGICSGLRPVHSSDCIPGTAPADAFPENSRCRFRWKEYGRRWPEPERDCGGSRKGR